MIELSSGLPWALQLIFEVVFILGSYLLLVLLVEWDHEFEVAEWYEDLRYVEWNLTFECLHIGDTHLGELEEAVVDISEDEDDDEDGTEDGCLATHPVEQGGEVMHQ